MSQSKVVTVVGEFKVGNKFELGTFQIKEAYLKAFSADKVQRFTHFVEGDHPLKKITFVNPKNLPHLQPKNRKVNMKSCYIIQS